MKETHKKSQTQLNPVDALAVHLASSVKKLDNEIKKNIQDKEAIVTSVASHLIMGKGKKIRPLLTLLFAPIVVFYRKLKDKGTYYYSAMGILLSVGYITFGFTHIAFGEEHINAFYVLFMGFLLPRVIK